MILALLAILPVLLIVNLRSWLKKGEARKRRVGILLLNILVGVVYLSWIIYEVHEQRMMQYLSTDDSDGIGWIVLGVMIAELHGVILFMVMLANLRRDKRKLKSIYKSR
ncbi:MAG TPA: hypothetical protein VL651_04830 [Bacteroidia bacterium]|nr:hypothetical protein [Bacteroidia bacterium]